MPTTYYHIDRRDNVAGHIPPSPTSDLTPMDAYEWMFGLSDVAYCYDVTEWCRYENGDEQIESITDGDEFLAKGEPQA